MKVGSYELVATCLTMNGMSEPLLLWEHLSRAHQIHQLRENQDRRWGPQEIGYRLFGTKDSRERSVLSDPERPEQPVSDHSGQETVVGNT